MILGITCHASTHLAMEAGEQGADYVAFGAFYETASKPKEKLEKWGTPTLELLEGWAQFSTLPCVAIGGLTPENCKPLIQVGADFVAVITGIWNHPQGAGAGVKAYNHAIQEALAARPAA
jgi:Thiamine monophosphate synthase